MRSNDNHVHQTQSTSALKVRPTIKRLALSLLIASVPFALYVRVESKNSRTAMNSRAAITVQAAGRDTPFFKLEEGREIAVEYRGDGALIEALRSGAAQSRSLAWADFDGNGTPDVVAGYSFNGVGMVTLQRGNPDAYAPADDSAFVRMQQGYNPESLLPFADVYPVAVPADFLAAGNFDNNSEKDILFAAKGGGLYLMAGDGKGGFGVPQQIALPGLVTAMAAGEFRAADGFTDVAVGVSGQAGNSLLIFDDAVDGFANALVQQPLAGLATAIEFGGFDDDPFMDVAVAGGSEILVVHGWGRKENNAAESHVERVEVGTVLRGLAVGEFAWDREGRSEIAALSDDGTVHIVQNAKLDTRPYSEAEAAERTRGKRRPTGIGSQDVESVPSWQPARATGWTESSRFTASSFAGVSSVAAKPLLRTNLSYRETDDLLLMGESQRKLEIVHPIAPTDAAVAEVSAAGDLTRSILDMESAPVAVLPLPRKLNGVRDVVVLDSASTAPNILPNPPNTTIVVDRTDDTLAAAATVCDNINNNNNCSLRGALQFANSVANNNTTISLPAGTYILTINGTSQGGCDGNTVGDLGANQTMSIVGAGAATTVIRQTATGPANDGDRVMCMNEPFTVGLIYNFSAFSLVGGREGTAAGAGAVLGGAGIIGGELNNSLTLTNTVFANNQETVAGSANLGGGGLQITGGNLIITNSTFGGTSAPGAYTDRSSTTTGNVQTGSGGGITYTPSSPMHTGGSGTLTMTGSTFSRNTSSGIGGGGADLLIFAFAAPGGIGSGSASIGTSTFSNNSAVNGGGIVVESLPTTVATTSFTNNSASNRGGAIYVGGGSLLLNGTTPSITMTGNTATSAGSSISTTGPVSVDGTNTTLGGDIEVNTGGTWTNNAGSTLSPTDVVVNGGTFNMNNSTMNVSGNLTIASPPLFVGTFNGGSGTVNLQGNFTFTTGGPAPGTTFNAGTGTFNFNGTGSQSISNNASIAFFNLTDSNVTQPLTANNSFAVNGSLNVNGVNAIFNPVAAAVISGTGTLTGTGTARVTRTAATADFLSQYGITNKTLTNLTVEYIGAGPQVLSASTYGPLRINNGSGLTSAVGTATVNGQLTLQAGALNVGNSTLVINNGTTVAAGSITSNPAGTVNYNQGSAGQDVRAFNYGNLTFSAQTKVLASTGTIGVSGTFNPNGVTSGHTITGSTINFNGTGGQTVPVFNYNNLTISGARGGATVTLAAGTIGVAGTFNPSATTVVYSTTGNTFDFNGTGAQTVPAFNYNNLTISGNRAVAITLGNGNVGIAGTFNPSVTGNTWTANSANTVVFNGAALQTIPAFAFFNSLTLNNAAGANLAGNVTVLNGLTLTAGALGVGTNTLTLNGAVSATAGSLTSAMTGTVNYNQGSPGQATVLAANYGNLTFSNFSKTLASTGTIGIAGVFTPGIAVHTITGSTINFNGTDPGGQTIPGFTYNNLTSSGGAVPRTLDPVNTIKIFSVFTPGTNVYTITGSTVEYNGAAAQTLPPTFTTYNNLTLNNPTTTAGFAGLTVNGLLRVQPGTFNSSSTYNNVQIDLGATLNGTAGTTINVSGIWTNNGTFTGAANNTVNFNGGASQTIGGTPTSQTFTNLTVNKAGGVLSTTGGTTSLDINGNLTITAGSFTSPATMTLAGNFTQDTGTTFTPGPGTVTFDSAGAQSIDGTLATKAFFGFTVNKGGGTLSPAAGTTALDINGVVTLTAGTFAAGTATAINVAGNWTHNGGVFTPGVATETVTFDGGAGQTIGGTVATIFNNLTNANASGLALANDNTVNGVLALGGTDITVAATKILTQPSTIASTGTSDVIGAVRRTGGPFAAATTLTFGNPNNQITFGAAGTKPNDLTVNLAKTAPPNPNGYAAAVLRTYTISKTGGAGFTATLRLHYLDTELNGNAEPLLSLRFERTGDLHWVAAVPSVVDQANNWVESNTVSDTMLPVRWTFSSLVPTASDGVITGRIVDQNGNSVEGAVVRLEGTQNRKFITDANGYYRFDNVETNGFYTVTPSRANYSFSPAERSFSQFGQATEATFSATAANSGLVNPLDTPEYFVRQHYVDFLNREPDEAGFNFWSDQIIECSSDQNCFERRRQNVSAAFFLSIEFQRTGGLVDGVYRAAYGSRPDFAHFLPDTRAVGLGVRVGIDGWEAVLATNTEAFVNSFVNRAEFHAAYDNLSDSQYVDALISHTGVSFTSAERDELLSGLGAGSMTRAEALRSIAGNSSFVSAKFNETFVMMEYYGYLRRDYDSGGYTFWLTKLNEHNGNFEQAEMVKAFIVSGEYRGRFPR